MRVLVTGGAGFIGSHTVDLLLERGYDVRILDALKSPVHADGRRKTDSAFRPPLSVLRPPPSPIDRGRA